MPNERTRIWGLTLVFILAFAVLVTGCGQTEQADGNVEVDGTHDEQAPEVEAEAETGLEERYPLTLVDGAGDEVVLEEEPQTIVSVLPSNTEIAFTLGLGDRIIGVTNWCNYPAEALEVDKVGDMSIDAEAILAKAPDLLLAAESQHRESTDTLDKLREAGIHVLVIQDDHTFDDVYENIELIAKATGTADKAESIVSDMKQRLLQLEDKALEVEEPKRVWVEVYPPPSIYTTGRNTFMHQMLESIQAVNVAGDHEGWVQLTEEEVVQLNPDVMITTYGNHGDVSGDEVLQRAGWGEVPAIKNELVFDVDNDTVTRPGPRLIDGVEALAKLIYPEIYSE